MRRFVLAAAMAVVLATSAFAQADVGNSNIVIAAKHPAPVSTVKPGAKPTVAPTKSATFQITEQNPIDPTCRTKAPGGFNSVHEYTCAYQIIRAFSVTLGDPAKRAEFDSLWAPDKVKTAPELKMDGVSDDDRKANTFALIRRMRDFTHERFDFIHDPVQSADIQKNLVHPVLDGGIGAILRLNNMYEILDSLSATIKDEDKITYGEYQKRLDAVAVIGPGHELVIDATVPDSPANGVLKAGDIVTAVVNDTGEHVLSGMSQSAAIKEIRGGLGTSVVLKVLRTNSAGRQIALSFTLQRVQVQQRAVTVHDVNGIRHITVENFTNDYLLLDFYNAVSEAQKLGMKGIDIDLRGNPGGRMDYVVGMLQMVVPRGLLLTTKMRNVGADGVTQTEYTVQDGYGLTATKLVGEPDSDKKVEVAERVAFDMSYARAAMRNPNLVYEHPLLPAIDESMPVTVMVNVDSYSASEIFAGAIQATHRGVIVGQPSAGKGAIMPELPLPEGGGMDITNGNFFPGGRDTKHKGVIPERIVEPSKDHGKTDAQQDAASAVIEEAFKNLQAVKALEVDRIKINDARFEDDMAKRDANDLKPPKDQDPRYQQ
jgi:C-terminal processing protease CtpA/Prc